MWYKTFIKNYYRAPFIYIFILGLILIILSPKFKGVNLEYLDLEKFFEVMGVAFISVAVTAPIADFFLFRTLSDSIKVVYGAQESGITNIFKSRYHDEESFNKAIEEAFKNAEANENTNGILMMGVAFPDIFKNINNDDFNNKSTSQKMYDVSFPIDILLLNPECKQTDFREQIEEGRGTKTDIYKTIESIQKILIDRAKCLKINLENIKLKKDVLSIDDLNRIKMKIRLYNIPPITYLIMTNTTLFLEQYHFGNIVRRTGRCIGGKIPVLQFNHSAHTYKIMQKHFDYIWGKVEKRDITKELLISDKSLKEIIESFHNQSDIF